jgi:hypothetical protein
VLSPNGERLAHERIRRAGGRDWYVQGLTVAGDESRVLVAYRPAGGHLMEFAVVGDVAYAFGNCVQGSGLARVPLERGSSGVLLRDACGDTAALLDDATFVVGRRRNRDPYGRGTDAGLVFVDLQAGKIERSLPLPEDPADLLAAG